MADNGAPGSSMHADYPQIRAATRGIDSAAGSLGGVKSVGAGHVVGGMWGSALGKASLDADLSLSEYAMLLSGRLHSYADAARATVEELLLTDGEFAALLDETLPE